MSHSFHPNPFDSARTLLSRLRGSPRNAAPSAAAPAAPHRVPVRAAAAGGRISRASFDTGRDTGAVPVGGLDVFLRMQRTDAQVRACLTTKRLAVLSETVEVHPADNSHLARRAAGLVEETLAALPGGAAGVIYGALDALAMGFALGEYLWSFDGNALADIRWHDPRRVVFLCDGFGDITDIEITDSGLCFPAHRFVRYTYQSRYNNPYGESDLLSAYRAWTTKDKIRRMWLTALDRFGAPTPVARLTQSLGQAEMDDLAAQLDNLQNRSSFVLPMGVDLALPLDTGRVEPARAFVTAIEYEDAQIARAILGQELTTQGSSGGGHGSNALGKVHQAVADDWIQSLRHEIAVTVLTGQIARQITLLLLGPDAPPPIVAFPNLTDSELAARRDLIAKLVAGQVIAPSEAWIREWLGLPEAPSPPSPLPCLSLRDGRGGTNGEVGSIAEESRFSFLDPPLPSRSDKQGRGEGGEGNA